MRERSTTAAPQPSAPARLPRKAAEPQPQIGALTSASAISPTQAASNPAPATSGLPAARSSRLSGTTLAASIIAERPMGRLIQNTQRQSSWTRLPPITGPSAAPSAPNADQVPIAAARALAGTDASSSDSDAGTIRPAPHAWMIRAAISAATPGAQAAPRRADADRARAGGEAPPTADPVSPPAGWHQDGGEDDRVTVEHPGQRAEGCPGVIPADVGKR